jgi:hypothetical protein
MIPVSWGFSRHSTFSLSESKPRSRTNPKNVQKVQEKSLDGFEKRNGGIGVVVINNMNGKRRMIEGSLTTIIFDSNFATNGPFDHNLNRRSNGSNSPDRGIESSAELRIMRIFH